MTDKRVVLLGGYPAKQCVRRTHLDHDPTVPPAPPEPEAVLQRAAAGRVFEDDVVVPALVAALGQRCVSIAYGDHRADRARRIAETVAAMDAGVEVIIGGQLPDDTDAGRCGSPDLLLRASIDATGRARYLPADIKHHMTLKPSPKGTVTVSALGAGFAPLAQAGFSHMTQHRAGDSLQLAHYTRMLQAGDRHPGDHLLHGAILGTSDFTALTGDPLGLVWYDLTVATEKTWSGTAEKSHRKRSILSVYDYEFALRQRVAQAARAGEPALVEAFGKNECGECPYADWCRTTAPAQDASFTLTKGLVSDREWRYLYAHGYRTVTALADAPVEDEDFRAGYAKAAAPKPSPGKRLDDLVRRARMHRDGIAFSRTGVGTLTIPAADVEIDFDVEWHPSDGHVYQWGARVRYGSDEATATYEHTEVSFAPLDEAGAVALAERFFGWMEDFVAGHEAAGRSVAIYHWTTPETTRAMRMLGEDRARRLFEGRFLDLKAWMEQRFFARDGFGLKHVAPVFGFKWRADDAGGTMSVIKIEQARQTADPDLAAEAQDWLLTYNDDDCAAQAAIRDALHEYVAVADIPAA